MLGLVVGVAVFMGVLALAVHLFCKYNPVVQQAPRIAGAAFEDAALSSARAIASQSFAKLATHADLPRFHLQVGATRFVQEDPRVRVQAFLDAVLRLANNTTCRDHGVDLSTVPRPDVLGDWLRDILVKLDETDAAPRDALGVLKCATQSVMAPFVIKAKMATQQVRIR